MNIYKNAFIGLVFFPLSVMAADAATEEKILNIYNWADYIPADVLEGFEKETGIKVNYDTFDSNEIMESKILAGTSGYDLVVPTDTPFLKRQIDAGIYQTLDKTLLSNYKNLDEALLKQLPKTDPKHEYSIPYLWGTLGIGYNVEKVKKALGDDFPKDSWELFFNPKYLSKLKDCGVGVTDSGTFMLSVTLRYQGRDPNSTDVRDYYAAKMLWKDMRPSIRYFSNSQHINDLANGDICLSVTWSGDVMMAKERAKEAKNGQVIEYIIPKEGTFVGFDNFAIPKDAKHVKEAHLFIDYMLRAESAARASNELGYPNANKASYDLLDKDLRTDPNVYPPAIVMKKFYALDPVGPVAERARTRLWTSITAGR